MTSTDKAATIVMTLVVFVVCATVVLCIYRYTDVELRMAKLAHRQAVVEKK